MPYPTPYLFEIPPKLPLFLRVFGFMSTVDEHVDVDWGRT